MKAWQEEAEAVSPSSGLNFESCLIRPLMRLVICLLAGTKQGSEVMLQERRCACDWAPPGSGPADLNREHYS